MTLEELWELFPIFLVSHSDKFKEYFLEEKSNLLALLENENIKIYHIGSTAVPNIKTKNIIDILLICQNIEGVANLLLKNGYRIMSKSDKRISLNKGYSELGYLDKVYHLHLRYENDDDERYFLRYLIEHKNIAKEYEKLKISLAKKYKHNRDAYTEGKTEFIKKYNNIAKREYCKLD